MSVSSPARFGLPPDGNWATVCGIYLRGYVGRGGGPVAPGCAVVGHGGKSLSFSGDKVSCPRLDSGISQLSVPISPTGLHFPYHLRSERPKPTEVTPQPHRKQKL